MSANKTEQMVRKCFCPDCEFYHEQLNTGAKPPCEQICAYRHGWQQIARAARRFVRMENKGKMRMLDVGDIDFINRNKILRQNRYKQKGK